ncbi:30S ribosomal protein S8 [Nitrosomonas sp.]|uniref:30S ribosomal protein S8 n=1 Tax=Nitrosomonas sp. TaxID=42353 RepID=UPI001DA093C1|nr:30S ribosomal protein S8 [Nitrosomonas sp.]MBX3616437.1 30S ribosomal protein S8 [Nitrosomonas sp.]
MSLSDPISDMLTRIRNAQMAYKTHAKMPSSKLKVAIANVLKDEGYIYGFEVVEASKKSSLIISLKYHCGNSVIEEIKRISKPGLRIYKSRDRLPEVKNGLGIAIVSTSKGVMTNQKAKILGIGGELLCSVV